MHLVNPLASGVRGCEGGTAELYVRGTNTRATYYQDFEATLPINDGRSVSLDSSGRAIVYVAGLTRVVVKDSSGNAALDFVAGVHAGAVELISQSATGIDYSNGSTGPGKPTTVQSWIDGWKTSSGAVDSKVAVGGVATILSSALFSLGGGLWNVKDPAYGATGNGTTDDTTAINNCISACQAAGGGIVFFPPGTYRTTAALVLPSKVSLFGSGPGCCRINQNSGVGNVITASSASEQPNQEICGLRMTLSAGTGQCIGVTAVGVFVTVHNCYFESGVANTGALININTLSTIYIDNCTFSLASNAENQGVRASAAFKNITITRCRLIANFGAWTSAFVFLDGATGGDCYVMFNTFDFTNMAAAGTGVATVFGTQTAGNYYFIGNRLIEAGGTGVPQGFIFANNSGSALLFEAFNAYGAEDATPIQPYGTTGLAADRTNAYILTRENRKKQTTDVASATLTLDTMEYGEIVVRRTTAAGAQTLNFEEAYEGASFKLHYWNDDGAGATGTITWGTTIRASAANFTVNANSISTYTFKFVRINGNSRWLQDNVANVAE